MSVSASAGICDRRRELAARLPVGSLLARGRAKALSAAAMPAVIRTNTDQVSGGLMATDARPVQLPIRCGGSAPRTPFVAAGQDGDGRHHS